MLHSQSGQILADVLRQLLREKGGYRILDRHSLSKSFKSNAGGGEAFAERIEHMRQFRAIRRPPAFSNGMAMTHHHETVKLVFAPAEGIKELKDTLGGYSLLLRSAARQPSMRGKRRPKTVGQRGNESKSNSAEPKLFQKVSSRRFHTEPRKPGAAIESSAPLQRADLKQKLSSMRFHN